MGGSASAISPDRSPPSWASRAYSTRKNGLPSVREASSPACSSLGITSATASTTVAASAALSPVSSSRAACRRASDSATSARAPVGSGCVRQVPRTSSRPDSTVSDRSRSTRRVGTSAQCRSSRTTTIVSSCAAAAETDATTASQVRNSAPSSSPPPTSRSAPRPRSTCCHGQSGGAPSSCEQRPTSSRAPRFTARTPSSPHSRDLPMPGSPVIAANAGVPWSARSRAASRAVSWSCGRRAARPGGSGRIARAAPAGGCGGGAAGDRARRRGLRWCGDRGAAAGAAPGQGRVLPEHRGLHVAQLGARLEAELGVEDLPDLAQHLEGVGLASGPGQRDRAQAPQPLAERVRRGERLQLGRSGAVVTEGQGGDRAVLQGDAAQLLQPGPLGHRGGGVLELDVRDARARAPAPRPARAVAVSSSLESAGGAQSEARCPTRRCTSLTVRSKRAASRAPSGRCSAYPGATVTRTVAGARGARSGSRARRSPET